MHSSEKEKEETQDEFSIEVKKIEEDAEQIMNNALKNKEEIIAKAKHDSAEMLEKKQAEFEKKKEEKIRIEKERIDKRKEDILKKSVIEIETSSKESKKKVPSAVKYVIMKLDEEIEGM